MPRKPLTERRDPTLPAAGVGWFLTRPGCPTASAGFGAAPQGPGTARSGLSPFAGGCHSEGRLNLKAAGWPTEVPRPERPLKLVDINVRCRAGCRHWTASHV